MTINERIAELEAKQEVITKEIAELKEEAKRESIKISYQTGDDFCYFSGHGHVYSDTVFLNSFKEYWKFHNVFPDKYSDKVQRFCDHVIKINNLLMQYKLALCPDYEPNWEFCTSAKYYIVYDTAHKQWEKSYDYYVQPFTVYFDKESAQRVADDLNRRGIEP